MWTRRAEGVKNGRWCGVLGRAGAFSGIPGAPAARPGGERSGAPALIEVVFRDGLGLSGIERGALVEVVGEGFLGGLSGFPTRGPMRSSVWGGPRAGWMRRGRSGLTDVGQDLGDGFRVGEERDEREGRLAGGTDEGEDFIDPSQEGGPPGGSGRGGIRCFRFAFSGWGDGTSGAAGGRPLRPETWAASALSSWARAVTSGLRGALGAKTPW